MSFQDEGVHSQKCLTLQEAASGMHPEWQNQIRGHFDPIFDITLIGKQK